MTKDQEIKEIERLQDSVELMIEKTGEVYIPSGEILAKYPRLAAAIIVYERWKLAAEGKINNIANEESCAGCWGNYEASLWSCSIVWKRPRTITENCKNREDNYCPVGNFCLDVIEKDGPAGVPLKDINLDLAWSHVKDEANKAGFLGLSRKREELKDQSESRNRNSNETK